MTYQEFWEMAPRQFVALLKRHEAHIKSEWAHTASVMALYANCHRAKDHRAFTVADFMPGEGAPKPTGMGPEVYAAFARAAEEYGASD